MYRPEIDGLRAIAVISVIIYHAELYILDHKILSGGFLGVDVFFVISGYLISRLIFIEVMNKKCFSFLYFYERRIRRILPALLFVMMVSFPFAWLFLLPKNFVNYSESILYSLGFSSNFYFHYTGQQYASENSLLLPFLHTWSLSVEEQFYIAYPIFILIIYRFLSKYLFVFLLIGFVASLLFAHWASQSHPSFNFYIILSRGWELLAGCILAFLEISYNREVKKNLRSSIFTIIGLIMILYAIIFFDDNILHPSFFTLIPVVGVSLIIWYSNKVDPVYKTLGSKYFVAVGLISYSLYLWHYPIFAFARITETVSPEITINLLLLILLIVISIATYYFIEKPFRDKNINFKNLFIIIVTFYLILIILNISTVISSGFKSRLPEQINKNLSYQTWEMLEDEENKKCFESLRGCSFNNESKNKVILVGDSITASLAYDLKERLENKDFQLVTSLFGGCLFYPGFNLVNKNSYKIHNLCNDIYFTNLREVLMKENNSVVIFGGNFPLHLNNYHSSIESIKQEETQPDEFFLGNGKYETLQDSFKNEVLKVAKQNIVILIYPIPEMDENVPQKLFNARYTEREKNQSISIAYESYKLQTERSFKLLDSIKHRNIRRVYPHKLFCDESYDGICISHTKDELFYIDNIHPSIEGAEIINNLLISEILDIKNFN